MLAGQLQQPVRVERVAATQEIEAELDALARCDVRQLRMHLFRALDGDAVLARQMLGVGSVALGGGARIQLEGSVGHSDLVGVGERLERPLEAALSDVTPGADDVGPDLNLHVKTNSAADRRIPEWWRPRSHTGGSTRASCSRANHSRNMSSVSTQS